MSVPSSVIRRIVELAKKLIRLSGGVPGKDVSIVFTGLRPGEKMKEELFEASEAQLSDNLVSLFLALGGGWETAA